MSSTGKVIPVEPATKIAGGVRVPAHSQDRPSEHKPKSDSAAAKALEKQEQALIAQNAKALSEQLFEVDNQQHQQRTGTGKGVASTFHAHAPHAEKHFTNQNHSQKQRVHQPGGGQACHKGGL